MVGTESPSRSSSVHSPAPSPQDGPGGGNDSYPPQRHAGAVGIGPEYGKGASSGDKFEGIKEEMKGKILRKPDLVQHGHDLRTGELKRRAMEDENDNPFKDIRTEVPNNSDRQDPPESDDGPDEKAQAATTAPEGTEKAERQADGQNVDKVDFQ